MARKSLNYPPRITKAAITVHDLPAATQSRIFYEELAAAGIPAGDYRYRRLNEEGWIGLWHTWQSPGADPTHEIQTLTAKKTGNISINPS
jgi:hypothetical protein